MPKSFFNMKLLRNCTTVLALVGLGLFGYMVMVVTRRQYVDVKTLQVYKSSHTDGSISVCLNGIGRNCINSQQLHDLVRILRQEMKVSRSSTGQAQAGDLTTRNMSKTSVGDNEWIVTPHEDIIRKLATAQEDFQMRSVANDTTFKTSYDAGITKQCLTRDYGGFDGWPTASVVIPFCENEKLVDVLHTVHSIIQRSPDELLEEVILIDDHTTKEDFKELLDNYCNAVFGNKVRIIRANHTLGLIQGRLLGARAARGDVIITMDAHMEVQETWLQALLYEIRLNRKTLATAMLDWMKPMSNGSWEYERGINSFMCVFSWDLGFGFAYPRPEIRDKRDKEHLDAFPAPCSVGTIWAIEKNFFQEIGELDEGMQLWGGENLDLPIRTWLFGGRAVQVPCAHAAHLERPKQRDYRYGWDKYILENYKRVVEVWFDDYKKHVYRMKPQLANVSLTDISDRLEVKKRAVHDFKWFLGNVYPELGIYDNNSFGYDWLRNIGMNKCLHKVGDKYIMWDCLGQPLKEGAWLTTDGYMRTDVQYWHVKGKTREEFAIGPEGATGLYQADWITKWIHWKGGPMMLYRKGRGVEENICMEAYQTRTDSLLKLSECDPDNKYQRWEWKEYTDNYQTFIHRKLKSSFNSDYHKALLDVKSRLKWRYQVT